MFLSLGKTDVACHHVLPHHRAMPVTNKTPQSTSKVQTDISVNRSFFHLARKNENTYFRLFNFRHYMLFSRNLAEKDI